MNYLMSVFQYKFDCAAVSEIIANETYSYWWSDISVIYRYFYIFHIYANSPYLEFSSTTWFVRIGLPVVKIQVEWSL